MEIAKLKRRWSERTIFMPNYFMTAVVLSVLAVVVLGLLVWGVKNPLIWWLLCVIGTGTGAGLLVWGILIYNQPEQLPFGSPAMIIGAGSGFLAGSVVLLVAAIIGSCSRKKHGCVLLPLPFHGVPQSGMTSYSTPRLFDCRWPSMPPFPARSSCGTGCSTC